MPRFGRNGFLRGYFNVPSISNAAANPHFAGTTGITLVDSFTPGFQLVLEQLGFCAAITAGASAGSQVFKLRKGGASGTVVATLTLALANVNALGEVTVAAVSGSIADLTLMDGDTWSLTRDASGTDYTTEPEGYFFIRYRQLPQQQA